MSESRFQSISPNPFIVGNPVRDASMFFGREVEFDLVEKFLSREHGGLLVFCGERRSGKTSILFQILQGRLGPEYIPVLIDMQSMAISNESEFLRRIAKEIADVVETNSVVIPDFDSDEQPSTLFLGFIKAVLAAYPEKKPVLMFDEYELFEDKIDAGILSKDLLHMLSHLTDTYPVYLIFTGSQYLEKRQKDYWRILSQSTHKSVSYLEKQDALRLITQPVVNKVIYLEGTEESIYRLTAGQPFYTQAVCQRLVDHLNEAHTNEAGPEILAAVVDDIVSNALSQMVFLWETLEDEEKIALSLLAEVLEDENSKASAQQLAALVKRRRYPLEIDESGIASALENLFKRELLHKEEWNPPSYNFRMDIWRHWVRMMHSTWQVVRQMGIHWRGSRRRWTWKVGIPFVLLVALSWFAWSRIRDDSRSPSPAMPTPEQAALRLQLSDRLLEATAFVDGVAVERVDRGFFCRIAGDRDHTCRVMAPGYVDSTFTVNVAAGDTLVRFVDLREERARLQVQTNPANATLWINGADMGNSPHDAWYQTQRIYSIEARLSGRETVTSNVQLSRDSVVVLDLPLMLQRLRVRSQPPGAEIMVDSSELVEGDFVSVTLGSHRFTASGLVGYSPRDTLVEVTPSTSDLLILLLPEPPGLIVVQAHVDTLLQRLRVNGDQRVRRAVPRWSKEMQAGLYRLEGQLADGRIFDEEIQLLPGQEILFDALRGRVVELRTRED